MTSKPMLLLEDNCPMGVLYNRNKLISYINEKYPNWIAQIKQNGIRAFVSVKNGKITAIRNRSDFPILHYFPELKNIEFPIKEALLDCEICVLDDKGKSNLYSKKDDNGKVVVAGIDYRSRSLKDSETIERFPITLIVFDVLKVDDDLMITKTYSERYRVMKSIIDENQYIKVVKNYDFCLLWDKVVREDLEGVVLKNPNSLYELGKRSKNYIKLKNYKIATIRVDDTELNDKGIKVFGTMIDDEKVNVECQIANADNIDIGTEMQIKYLERVGNKLTQPTKITMAQKVVNI